ncbi:roundabout homolog 2-like isoform X2 [Dermacentor albipictus]
MLIRTWTQGCRCKNDTTVIAKDQKNSPISFSHRGGGGYARVSRSVQLVDLVVRKHELVTFRCGIYGSPPPKIAWFHDGGPIRNSATRMFLPIGQLFLLQVQHKAARNRTVDSAGARPLTCWASETIVSGLPVKHGTSKQVQRMRFMCRIRLLPALSCTQCFAASALRPNSLHVASVQPGMGRGHLLYQSALQITDVCPIEKGCYVCRAANMLGTRDSPPALLSVHMAICAMGLHGVFSSKKKKTFSSHVATQRWPSIRTADQDLVTYGRKHKKSVEIAAK